MIKVFVYDLRRPWNPVWETEAEIRTNKQSWTILPNGKRKLLGFFSFLYQRFSKAIKTVHVVENFERFLSSSVAATLLELL